MWERNRDVKPLFGAAQFTELWQHAPFVKDTCESRPVYGPDYIFVPVRAQRLLCAHTQTVKKIKVEYSLELETKILFRLKKGRHLGLATFIRRCYIRCVWWRSPFIKRCYEHALWISYAESSVRVVNRQANFGANRMCGRTRVCGFFFFFYWFRTRVYARSTI